MITPKRTDGMRRVMLAPTYPPTRLEPAMSAAASQAAWARITKITTATVFTVRASTLRSPLIRLSGSGMSSPRTARGTTPSPAPK